MITFTIDLEDPTDQYTADGRYVLMTRRILDICETLKRRATFFVVGRAVDAAPSLIRDIAEKGHEIAYHSHAHVPLTQENPDRFRTESFQDKDKIEQLTGRRVIGFRAPQFSLTPHNLWVIDSLDELGFLYSSSIMPTNISRFGFHNAPHTPFIWPNGLIEFPLPVAKIGTLRIPYLGGIYLYLMPTFLTQAWIKQTHPQEILWTYTHPYDFDHEDIGAPMANTPRWASLILGMARLVADKKVMRLLQNHDAPPLGERLGNPKTFPQIRF